MSDYYVYALLDPRRPKLKKKAGILFDHLPKYIGKGRGKRAHHSAFYEASYTNSPKARWVRRLRKEGHEPILVFAETDMIEIDSFELERKLITAWGLKLKGEGPLLNRSYGGEGGKHFNKEAIQEYKELLKTRGPELRLVGTTYGLGGYADHRCRVHGVVKTAPQHVMERLRNGKPLCPRCGEEKRGPQMREHRLATGEASYRELLASQDRKRYQLKGSYVGATKLTTHWCKDHGLFDITPANVRQKITQGLSPCPVCNRNAKHEAHKQIMRDYHAKRRAKK